MTDTSNGLPVVEMTDVEIPPPERWEARVADITAPLLETISTLSFELAQAKGEARAWAEHAGLLAEQVASLKATIAEIRPKRIRTHALEGG